MKIPEFEFLKKRSVKIWLAIILILLLVGGAFLLVWQTSSSMFAGNQRFTITDVRVDSKGFWQDKKELLCEILRIQPGLTNLFSLNPGELRTRLLQREPSIQQVKITRILPDTLTISILERIPVALINSPKSPFVVDAESILMNRTRCMDISYSLPVIVGLQNVNQYAPGTCIRKLENAVELIMLTKTTYPDLKIASISILVPDQLSCAIYYKNDFSEGELFRVLMPEKDIPRTLRKLVSALEQIRKTNSPRRNINLLFKNMSVITMASPQQPVVP